MRIMLVLISLFYLQVTLALDFDPTQIYIDKDVCPGEWCRFGDWTATRDIPIYKLPNSTEPPIDKIKKDQTVKAITGNAYVKPQKYVLTSKGNGQTKSEVIWVLTYQGEGFFRVWENGKIQNKELGFSPYGPDIFLPYEVDWWVKFELPNGVIGWAKIDGGFKDE
jgi:hypothetical protein